MNGAVVLEDTVGQLRAVWEETSFQLDRLQAEPRCVAEEEQGLRERTGPSYCLPPTFPEASVPHEPGEGACAVPASPFPNPQPRGQNARPRRLGLPKKRRVGELCDREGGLWPRDTPPPRQVVPCPESPSCERRAVTETVRWQMPSTWLGLR